MYKRIIRAGITLGTLLVLSLSCYQIQTNQTNAPVVSIEEQNHVSVEKNNIPVTSTGYDIHDDIHEIPGLDTIAATPDITPHEGTGIRYINNSAVNVRAFPTLSGEVIERLDTNTEVELLTTTPTGFCQIQHGDVVGFVYQDYLSETKIVIKTETKPEYTPVIQFASITNLQERVAAVAKNNLGTRPCKAGWCAAWVSGIYQAAGLGYPGGNAIDYWTSWSWSGSTDMNNIPVGAVIVGSGSGSAAGNKFGHVGIYIGNGMVADNPGYHRIIRLEEWAASQRGNCSGYHGYIGWVWPYGTSLGDLRY